MSKRKKNSGASWCNPFDLLSPERLDFIIKRRFFLHLMHGGDQDSERLYRWHIETRTGGVEGKKASVDDYVEACVALLKSVETRGFMQEYPVLLDPDGRLFNGAHRVSLGLAINKPLCVRQVNAPAKRTWGFDWFADHGMSRADLLRLVEDWCLLRGVE